MANRLLASRYAYSAARVADGALRSMIGWSRSYTNHVVTPFTVFATRRPRASYASVVTLWAPPAGHFSTLVSCPCAFHWSAVVSELNHLPLVPRPAFWIRFPFKS